MSPHFFTAPFYFAFIWFRVQGSRGGFAANIPMTIHAAPFFSLIQGSQPRLASLVCPFQRKGRE